MRSKRGYDPRMDAIPLTRALLHFDTVNPPGREADCARHAGKLLQDWGYRVAHEKTYDR